MSAQAAKPHAVRRVWIVEDESDAAALAAELCASCGAERELSAALFLATRHRYPTLRVVYSTGTTDALPGTVREDRCTRIVDKADGAAAFEQAVAWALTAAAAPPSDSALP